MTKKWRRVVRHSEIRVVRQNWLGVWDALVAVVTGRPQRTVVQPVVFSIYVCGDKDIGLFVTQATVEIGGPNNEQQKAAHV